MSDLITAAWISQALAAAADLRVADALSDGPLPIDELATRVGADPDALARLLRALISQGIFRQRRDGSTTSQTNPNWGRYSTRR